MQLRFVATVALMLVASVSAWAQGQPTGAAQPQMSQAERDMAALRENMGRQMSAAHTQEDNMIMAISVYIQGLQKQLDESLKRERGWEQYARPLWEPQAK